jgi:hypothetical protein
MLQLLMVGMMLQGAPSMPIRSLDKATQSFVDTARQVTARTPDEWAAIWKQHAPGRPMPAVDFSREMVVGVFLGSRNRAGYSVEIVGVEKEGNGLVVRYKESVPGRSTMSAQIITMPVHLVAVPKTEGTVRFEKVER